MNAVVGGVPCGWTPMALPGTSGSHLKAQLGSNQCNFPAQHISSELSFDWDQLGANHHLVSTPEGISLS